MTWPHRRCDSRSGAVRRGRHRARRAGGAALAARRRAGLLRGGRGGHAHPARRAGGRRGRVADARPQQPRRVRAGRRLRRVGGDGRRCSSRTWRGPSGSCAGPRWGRCCRRSRPTATPRGLDEWGGGIGDLAVTARYDFLLAAEAVHWPGIALLAGATFPTGTPPDRATRTLATDATGAGTYDATIGLGLEKVGDHAYGAVSGWLTHRFARTVSVPGAAPLTESFSLRCDAARRRRLGVRQRGGAGRLREPARRGGRHHRRRARSGDQPSPDDGRRRGGAADPRAVAGAGRGLQRRHALLVRPQPARRASGSRPRWCGCGCEGGAPSCHTGPVLLGSRRKLAACALYVGWCGCVPRAAGTRPRDPATFAARRCAWRPRAVVVRRALGLERRGGRARPFRAVARRAHHRHDGVHELYFHLSAHD